MAAYPPDVIVLDTDSLLHARIERDKRGVRIVQAKAYRLAADTFSAAVVTPELTNEASLVEVLRRLRVESGRWDKVSILLPDSWFRINMLDIPSFNERQSDALEVVRWSLKRTIPIAPEELRITWQVISHAGAAAKLLVVSALAKTLATIERIFGDAGMEVAMIEPIGLNVWNAIGVREAATAKDRLFLYVRDREFTTAVSAARSRSSSARAICRTSGRCSRRFASRRTTSATRSASRRSRTATSRAIETEKSLRW